MRGGWVGVFQIRLVKKRLTPQPITMAIGETRTLHWRCWEVFVFEKIKYEQSSLQRFSQATAATTFRCCRRRTLELQFGQRAARRLQATQTLRSLNFGQKRLALWTSPPAECRVREEEKSVFVNCCCPAWPSQIPAETVVCARPTELHAHFENDSLALLQKHHARLSR